jgi:hypothetical protein
MEIGNSVSFVYIPNCYGGLSSKGTENAMQRSTSAEHAYLTRQFAEETAFVAEVVEIIRTDWRRNTNAGEWNSSK